MGRMMRMGMGVACVALLVCNSVFAEPLKTKAVRSDVRLVVQVASTGLGGLLADVQSRDERIRLVREFVSGSRFFPSKEGYFFVYDTKGVCIAHGVLPELEGQMLMDFKDKAGFPVVKAIVDTGKDGGGYIEYLWSKPGKEGTFEKLAYVERIPGTDFIIGSGLYFLDIW